MNVISENLSTPFSLIAVEREVIETSSIPLELC
jgi:hypothetical protein